MSIDTVWLEENVLGRKLTSEERTSLAARLEVSTVPKDGKIITQGQRGGTLCIIRSGSAVVRQEGHPPNDVATVGMGAAVGDMSFLTDETASASVIALSDCEVYRISRAAFSELMGKHTELVFSFFVYILRHTASVIRSMNVEHVRMMHYIVGGRMG